MITNALLASATTDWGIVPIGFLPAGEESEEYEERDRGRGAFHGHLPDTLFCLGILPE